LVPPARWRGERFARGRRSFFFHERVTRRRGAPFVLLLSRFLSDAP
jgi:hypothetical protein